VLYCVILKENRKNLQLLEYVLSNDVVYNYVISCALLQDFF
jgi:hypothetical protein